MFNPELEKYIDNYTSIENKDLQSLDRETNLKTTMPRMLSGKVQGKFLEMISYMIKPNRILEIGTFTGYSAICMAKGLAPSGKIYTIESNEELEPIIRKYIDKTNLSSKIELIIGNALVEIPKLKEKFDLVFIDADKEQYIDYYNLAKTKLKPGGFILADNVLWGGKVLNTNNPGKETSAIQAFNNYVMHDKSVEQVLVPLRDGLLLIKSKQD
ncbi:MAG: O-methyltransferase [Bacteroidota bacterium]